MDKTKEKSKSALSYRRKRTSDVIENHPNKKSKFNDYCSLEEVLEKVKSGELNQREAAKLTGFSQSTICRKLTMNYTFVKIDDEIENYLINYITTCQMGNPISSDDLKKIVSTYVSVN